MSLLFTIGVIALVIGGLTLAFDGAIDLPDSEWFSLTGITAGVAMYCFTAGTITGFGAPLLIASIPGVIAALAVIIGTSWLVYRLRNAAPGPDLSDDSLVGLRGKILTSVPPGETGEIDIAVHGERIRFNAVSEAGAIPAGVIAEVVGVVSPTCVRVVYLR